MVTNPNEQTIQRTWNRFRTNTRNAFNRGDWLATVDQARAFEAYCSHHGWPDWWSDIQRMMRDAITNIERERERW